MSNTYFQFKQFCIHHDRCAMKVGTDGVLVGAWSPLEAPTRILDVGTGSGLIALMLAQRFREAEVVGIDIDEAAILQARENAEASPFRERVHLIVSALQDVIFGDSSPLPNSIFGGSSPLQDSNFEGKNAFQDVPFGTASFDAVVCNPPFFEEQLLPPDEDRSHARHTTTLPFPTLVECAACLLRENGQFCVILPSNTFDSFRQLCFVNGLSLSHRCVVQTSPKRPAKRVLACFRKGEVRNVDEQSLTLSEAGGRSRQYAHLTADFYLH